MRYPRDNIPTHPPPHPSPHPPCHPTTTLGGGLERCTIQICMYSPLFPLSSDWLIPILGASHPVEKNLPGLEPGRHGLWQDDLEKSHGLILSFVHLVIFSKFSKKHNFKKQWIVKRSSCDGRRTRPHWQTPALHNSFHAPATCACREVLCRDSPSSRQLLGQKIDGYRLSEGLLPIPWKDAIFRVHMKGCILVLHFFRI